MTRPILIFLLLSSFAAAPEAFGQCKLTAILNSVLPVRCAGTATGSAFVSVSSATPPVQFFADGMGPAFPNGDLMEVFFKGNHSIVVVDAAGCRDTVFFTVSEPDSLKWTVTSKNVRCNGGNNGFAKAVATGGIAPISFMWKTCAGATLSNADSLTSLFKGCYAVTATDANGCTLSDSVQITEPAKYVFTSVQDSVNCFGGADGTATVFPSGNTPPYTYSWDNGQMTQTATGLNAGFHTVIVLDSLLCQAGTLVQVLQAPKLQIDSIKAEHVQCFGQINGTAEVVVKNKSGTPSYSYKWENGQTAAKAEMLAMGVYMVTVTDWHQCTATATVAITEPPLLSATALNVKSEQCAGDCKGEAIIQATGGVGSYDYLWNTPSIPDGTAAPKNLCPGAYLVTVKDAQGCTATQQVTIQAATPLVFNFDKTPPTCAGFSNGSIQTTVSGGSQPYQYAWSNGSVLPDLPNIPCGKQVLTLTDSIGCVQVRTVEVPCPSPLQIQSVVAKAVRCFGIPDGNIVVTTQGGMRPYTYLWNDPQAQKDSIAIGLPTGTYTVTVTDNKGCTATATAFVSQPPQLVVATTTTPVTCFGGGNGSATATATGGTLGHTFLWEGGTSGPQISSLTAGVYTLTATDQAGCSTTATATVSQPTDSILLKIKQLRPACYGQKNGSVQAIAAGGNGMPFSYAWSTGQSTPVLTSLNKIALSLTVTDSKGCTQIQSDTSKELDTIIINFSGIKPSCYGASDGRAVVNDVYGGAGMKDTTKFSYQWNLPNATSRYLLNIPAGVYRVIATDSLGCQGSYTQEIEQPKEIKITSEKTDITCFGLTNGLARVISAVGEHPITSYQWSNNGVAGPQNPGLGVGTYIVTVTDTKGCTNSDTIKISEPPPLQVSFSVQPLVCSADMNAVVASSVSGGTPDYTLAWNTGDSTPTLSKLGPGMYILTVTDQNGCVLTDSIPVASPDEIRITTQVTDPVCFGGQTGRIRLLVEGGQQPYRYALSGGGFTGSSVFIGLQAGMYSLQVRDVRGCISQVNATVSQPLPVLVSLGLDTSILLHDSLLLLAEVSNAVGTTTYTWSSQLDDLITCVDTLECDAVLVKPLFSNTYRVAVTDANGCRGEDAIQVSVKKSRDVFVPTGFSPNNDGNNDRLLVHGKGRQIRRVVSFQVFDRWGELLYQAADFQVNDAAQGWDGQFRGQPCAAGTYVWQLEVEYVDGFRDALSGGTVLTR